MKRVVFRVSLFASAAVLVFSVAGLIAQMYFLALHVVGAMLVITTALLYRGKFSNLNDAFQPKKIASGFYYFTLTFIGFLILSFIAMLVIATVLFQYDDRVAGQNILLYGIFTGIYTIICAWLFIYIGRFRKRV